MSKHKKQHFVPKSYLKAWCDPQCPKKHTPYVWIFNKEERTGRRKAPENIFHETDLYTLRDDNGNRILRIEKGFSGLERDFATARIKKVSKKRPIDSEEDAILRAFAATMHARTKARLDHLKSIWDEPLRRAEELNQFLRNASEEEKAHIHKSTPPCMADSERSISLDEMRQMAQDPIRHIMLPVIEVEARHYAYLDCAILWAPDTNPGFITSDSPCCWFDPVAYKRPPLYRAPALMYPTIEISLPISPQACLLLNRHGLSGYHDIDIRMVTEINRRTRFMCNEHYIVNSNTTMDEWFDRGEEPADSWDNQRRKEAASKRLSADTGGTGAG